jgi:hypothetical protein
MYLFIFLKEAEFIGWSQTEKTVLTAWQSVNDKVQENICTQIRQDNFIPSSAIPRMCEQNLFGIYHIGTARENTLLLMIIIL